ncbi:MAG: hypothetical protein NWE92_03080 [Candidatus Bathyarchaeota archaeon]|nr:hypothetical protein [Candidatus Bathyarchaeota archaeon]
MPLASFLAEMLKSGKVTVSAGNVEALEILVADKKIDIKALDKEFVKDALSAAKGEGEGKGLVNSIKGAVGQLKTARSSLDSVKDVAEELADAGITVTLTYKDTVVVTLGSEANPKFSSAATGTKAIEINSPRKLLELGL